MRQLVVTLFACLLFCCNSYSQTTQTEYDYITKSYRTVEEAGMDVKSGYSVVPVTKASSEVSGGKEVEKRSAQLNAFYRSTGVNTKKLVAYIIVYQKQGYDKEYICVPHPSSSRELFQVYANALYNSSGDQSYRLQVISLLLSKGLAWL